MCQNEDQSFNGGSNNLRNYDLLQLFSITGPQVKANNPIFGHGVANYPTERGIGKRVKKTGIICLVQFWHIE